MNPQPTDRPTRPLTPEQRRIIVDAFARAVIADLRVSGVLPGMTPATPTPIPEHAPAGGPSVDR